MKLGIDAKTVNKVYGKGFIPTFDVMLGTSIDHCKIPEGTWFHISQKLNGSRCVYYKGSLYTRQGKEYTGLEHIISDVQKLNIDDSYVLDGELVFKNDGSLSDSEAFQKGTGIAMSKDKDKTNLKFVVFDTISTEDFEHGISQHTYSERLLMLRMLKENMEILGTYNLETVKEFYEGTNQAEIWNCLCFAEDNDMEGIMLNLDTPYECKRTKNLIKVKRFYTMDLKVVDYVEGSGRLKGTLGALVVDYKGNKVNVGSGFDEETRKRIWEDKENVIGKIIEVKYKEVTKNKDGGESLQFPVFLLIRSDKTEVSYE